MKYSFCIPNYNYGGYLGETIDSALSQEGELEVLFCDNASTDNSLEVARSIAARDPRLKIRVNRWNVGFAGNLDRACIGATGERQLLLSSDDLILPGALSIYSAVLQAMGDQAPGAILTSGFVEVDGSGTRMGESEIDWRMWHGVEPDPQLSQAAGCPVYVMSAREQLGRALRLMRVPMAFLTTCYTREMYDAVEGYSNGRLINPDKAFAWKIMSVAETMVYVDAPLFAYRVHANNQGSLQARSGALKHLVDQYAASFDTPAPVLERAGLTSADLARAFVEEDILLRGFKKVAEGDRKGARRGLAFGKAAYPDLSGTPRHALLHVLARLGPLGTAIAAAAYRRRMGKRA